MGFTRGVLGGAGLAAVCLSISSGAKHTKFTLNGMIDTLPLFG